MSFIPKIPFSRRSFGYSRLEFRGLTVLFVVLLVVILIRIVRTPPPVSYELFGVDTVFETSVSGNSCFLSPRFSGADRQATETVKGIVDPNTATFSAMIDAGIPSDVATRILVCRLKGAVFCRAEDLKRIQGLDSTALTHFQFLPGQPDRFRIVSDLESGPKLEINTADTIQWAALPGIGPVLSRRIVKYRNWLGGFYSVEQLSEVYGISDSLLQRLQHRIRVDSTHITKININIPGQKMLFTHPYLTRNEAKAIQSYLRITGSFTALSQLRDNYLLSDETYQKIRPYLSLE